MRALTHREWERHFPELRAAIAERWPDVDEKRLEAAGPDWERLVELVRHATGQPADEILRELRRMDLQELGLDENDSGAADSEADRATDRVAATQASLNLLRLGGEFDESDRPRVLERLDKLNRRLRKFPADGTDLHLTVKDRDTTGQKVTLEAWLPKFGHVAATSNEPDLRAALMDVREDLWRQIDDAVNRRKGN